jgi:hypothetical protein
MQFSKGGVFVRRVTGRINWRVVDEALFRTEMNYAQAKETGELSLALLETALRHLDQGRYLAGVGRSPAKVIDQLYACNQALERGGVRATRRGRRKQNDSA